MFSPSVSPPTPKQAMHQGRTGEKLAEVLMASALGFWLTWSLASLPCRHRGPRARNVVMLHVLDFLGGGAHGCLGEVLSRGW